jgi:hypothetical protein
MRCTVPLSASLLTCSFASCAEMTVDDIRVHAFFGTLHPDDIRAAIAADRLGYHFMGKKIYEIQVISGSEMHFYRAPITESPSYEVVRRVHGKWRLEGSVIITE